MLNPGLGDVRDVASANRLSQTEPAIFRLWRLYFQRITFQLINVDSFGEENNGPVNNTTVISIRIDREKKKKCVGGGYIDFKK